MVRAEKSVVHRFVLDSSRYDMRVYQAVPDVANVLHGRL